MITPPERQSARHRGISHGGSTHAPAAVWLRSDSFLSPPARCHAQSPPCSFPLAYPGDSAPREAIAAWMAARATADRLPPELPVMAALVESGLSKCAHGDADSVGFFQMRVGNVESGSLCRISGQPELQMKWFLDQATAVRNLAIAHGHGGFDESPDGFGRWIDSALRPSKPESKELSARVCSKRRRLIAAGRAHRRLVAIRRHRA